MLRQLWNSLVYNSRFLHFRVLEKSIFFRVGCMGQREAILLIIKDPFLLNVWDDGASSIIISFCIVECNVCQRCNKLHQMHNEDYRSDHWTAASLSKNCSHVPLSCCMSKSVMADMSWLASSNHWFLRLLHSKHSLLLHCPLVFAHFCWQKRFFQSIKLKGTFVCPFHDSHSGLTRVILSQNCHWKINKM